MPNKTSTFCKIGTYLEEIKKKKESSEAPEGKEGQTKQVGEDLGTITT